MSSPASRSVFRSLTRKVLLPLLLIGGAVVTLAVWSIEHESREQLEQQLQQRAELLAGLVNYAAASVSLPGELQRIVIAAGAEPDVLEIVVVGGRPSRVMF